MNESKVTLDKKAYQVFVHGYKDEQAGDVLIQSPRNPREDLTSRGLGNSRFLNLYLIEKFSAADNGDFGGSGSAEQATMFESTSPIHFGQLEAAILAEKFDKQPDLEITDRNDLTKKIKIPVVKLNGVFRDSAIHVEGVDTFYLAFRREGVYELQNTDRYIGSEWITTPSENTTISVVLFGADANEGNLIKAIAKEERRMNVEAFNKDEIKEMARQAGVSISDFDKFRQWFAEMAPARIKAVYDGDVTEEPVAEIVQGAATRQPPVVPATPVAKTGTTGNQIAQPEVVG